MPQLESSPFSWQLDKGHTPRRPSTAKRKQINKIILKSDCRERSASVDSLHHVKVLLSRESESLSVVSDSLRSPWDSPGQNTGVGGLSLPQEIFPTQESNPGLLHCRRILYQLSHQGSPRILEWVADPFSGDLPDPGIEPGSPALQADSLSAEISGKPLRH